jgi:hypothetical protein
MIATTYNDKTKNLLEEMKSDFLNRPLDTVVEQLDYFSGRDDLPEDVRLKLKDFADKLRPGVATLVKVEHQFLDLFFPEG